MMIAGERKSKHAKKQSNQHNAIPKLPTKLPAKPFINISATATTPKTLKPNLSFFFFYFFWK